MTSKAQVQAAMNLLRGQVTDSRRAAEAAMAHALGVEMAAADAMQKVGAAADEQIKAMQSDLDQALLALAQFQPHNDEVFQDVFAERVRQDAKHGAQLHLDDLLCHLFTAEEVGEVSKALLEREVAIMRAGPDDDVDKLDQNLYDEIIQTAACFVKWAQIIKARGIGPAEQEEEHAHPSD